MSVFFELKLSGQFEFSRFFSTFFWKRILIWPGFELQTFHLWGEHATPTPMGQLTTLTENLDIYYTFEVFGAKIQIALIISLKRKLTWQITFFCGYLLTRTFSKIPKQEFDKMQNVTLMNYFVWEYKVLRYTLE